MTRYHRLMNILQGKSVDRPAVNFYEIGGYECNPDDSDPYNVYNSPSWRPLIQLAKEKTDLIRFTELRTIPSSPKLFSEFFKVEQWEVEMSRFAKTTLTVAGKTMTNLTRRDASLNTVWILEHLLKSTEDVELFLRVPDNVFLEQVDCPDILRFEQEIGDAGITMIDIADPLCIVAQLFSMENFTITAMTETKLFHRLLEKLSSNIYAKVCKIAQEYPGHLWRIYGPEYATEPYLPPKLFKEYVVRYTGPMIKMIQEYDGYARIHLHGNIRNVLPYIVEMGADGIDPIEPPPQGDIELGEVREKYGKDMILFGNLEITDIENLPPNDFEQKVAQALREGTSGNGRGFVLMPSGAPYGRTITMNTMRNYETMVRLTGDWN